MGGRTNPRALAALAITARHTIDALATTITVEKVVYLAIDEVAAFARGDKVTKAQLMKTSYTVDKLAEGKRDWKAPQRKDYHWAVGAVAVLASMAASGGDHEQLVLDHLGYGLAEQAKAKGRPDHTHVGKWFAEAKKLATSISGETLAKKVNAKSAAIEAAALARIAKALGKHGKLLAKRGARWSATYAGSPAALTALLAKKKLKATKAVLAFDAMFGGLMIPDSADEADDWFESGAATFVGAFACLKLRRGRAPDGGHAGHVPVVFTMNDNEVYLDEAGAVWAMDTIEDRESVKIKETPGKMLVRVLESV